MPHADHAARLAYSREYKRRNRYRFRARQRAYDCAKHANERAERYGCEGVLTTEEAVDLLAPNACHYCGTDRMLGLDHVIPLSNGGLNRPANIVPSCQSCNSSKGRTDRPGRWSRDRDSCVDCGTAERPHFVHGRCARCYSRERGREERAAGKRCDGMLVRGHDGSRLSCSRGERCPGLDKTHSAVTLTEPWREAGFSHPNQRLTPAMVAEIRTRYAAGGVTYAALAAEYGVVESAIGGVVRGRTGGQRQQ